MITMLPPERRNQLSIFGERNHVSWFFVVDPHGTTSFSAEAVGSPWLHKQAFWKDFSKKLTAWNMKACRLLVGSNLFDIVFLAKMMHVSFIFITGWKCLEQGSQFCAWLVLSRFMDFSSLRWSPHLNSCNLPSSLSWSSLKASLRTLGYSPSNRSAHSSTQPTWG